MKNVSKAIMSGVLLLLVGCNQVATPPSRPINVPIQAVWIGGVDGGYWVEFVLLAKGAYRFKLFTKREGELVMDAYFMPSSNCQSRRLPANSGILKLMEAAMEEEIYLAPETDTAESCVLKMQSPAFGGSGWEIMKQKAP